PAVASIVVAPVIDAVADDYTASPVNGSDGGTVGSVLDNDLLNGNAIATDGSDTTISVLADGGLTGVSLADDGTLTVPAGTAAGSYDVTYEICSELDPAICEFAVATVVVAAPAIDAVDDSVENVDGQLGITDVLSVFENDTLNGAALTDMAQVSISVIAPATSIGTAPVPFLDTADGTVDVPVGTPQGSYEITYEICELVNPTNCAQAVASITISATPPVAQDDLVEGLQTGVPATLNPLDDNGNGVDSDVDGRLEPSTLVLTGTGAPSGSVLAADGKSLSVPGQGVWTVDTTTGEVIFSPEDGFTADPAPVAYTVADNDGNVSNEAIITLQFVSIPPVAQDDLIVDLATGSVATVDPFGDNGNGIDADPDGSLDPSSMLLTGTGAPAGSVLSADGKALTVPGEGVWAVDAATGEVTFTPLAGFNDDPAPVAYSVADNDGNVSNEATIEIDYGQTVSMSLIKSVSEIIDTFSDGNFGGVDDTLRYSFVVTNTGELTLQNVVVQDAALGGAIATIATLGLGETTTVTYDYVITEADRVAGRAENSASVTGTGIDRFGNPEIDPGTGNPLVAEDVSDAGTDASTDPISDPEGTETPDSDGNVDGDPANDPTVTAIPVVGSDTYLSGKVFRDNNLNDIYDDGVDDLLPNFVVKLLTSSGGLVRETRSDAVGFYEMADFAVGTNYSVNFNDPDTGETIRTISGLDFPAGAKTTGLDSFIQPVNVPELALSKVAAVSSVIVGGSVPYEITVKNSGTSDATDISVVDTMPAGISYVAETAKVDGVLATVKVSGASITFSGLTVPAGGSVRLSLVGRLNASATTGDMVNRAIAYDSTGAIVSNEATATVTLKPEAVFNCSDIIGRVFDDRNMNGYQDEGGNEPGLAGVRIMTVDGLVITTDSHGRYSVPCAALPKSNGSNFVLKVDVTSLPTGYRMTTENPRVQRLTPGIMTKFNFGAAISNVVDLDLVAVAFDPKTNRPVPALAAGVDQLVAQLRDQPSVLRLSYFRQGESQKVARARLDALENLIRQRWSKRGRYQLLIERTIQSVQ
ncbi:putative repeat protein (TIGR01451 family), partial [Primorskyibacter sedentarius]